MNNNFVVTWTQNADPDFYGYGGPSLGVYAREYASSGAQIRPDFRINSASLNAGAPTTWAYFQFSGQAVMDADGDMTGIYEGYNADASTSARTGAATTLMQDLLNAPQNADLIALWPALATLRLPFDGMNSGDTDSVIEEVLINAQKLHGFNDEQLGRLRAIMETVADLLRGEAYGIGYSQFDADPNLGPSNIIASDSIANSMRDGVNARWIFTLPANAMDGTFYIGAVSGIDGSGDVIGDLEPAWMPFGDDKIIDPDGTTAVIQDAFNSSPFLFGNCVCPPDIA